MTSVFRSRSRSTPVQFSLGSHRRITRRYRFCVVNAYGESVTPKGATPEGSQVCHDRLTIGTTYEPNPLALTKTQAKAGSISGSHFVPPTVDCSDSSFWQWENRYVSYAPTRLTSQLNSGIKVYSPENPALWLTNALGQSVLNEPIVDVPLFFFELPDLIKQVKQLGDILTNIKRGNPLKDFSPVDITLATNFGWKPLMNDVLSLIGAVDAIDSRLRDIGDARAGRPIRRTLKSEDSEHEVIPVYNVGASTELVLRVFDRREVNIWYTGHWKILDQPEFNDLREGLNSNAPYLNRASNLLGQNVNPSTLWNMLPWSWLVDYFTNLGTYVSVTGNSSPATLQDVCLMIKDEVTETSEVLSNPHDLSYGPHEFLRSSKARHVYQNPQPSVQLDLELLPSQVFNILAVLSVLAAR